MRPSPLHGRFVKNRPCIPIAVVGFSRELLCEIDTAGEYALLLPWIVAVSVGFRPTFPRNRLTLPNGYRMLTRRGILVVRWPGGDIDVPTRVYGKSTTSSAMWLNATPRAKRPYQGIDGYIGSHFFQQDEKVMIDYTQGAQSIRIEF